MHFVEAFGGSAAVTAARKERGLEVYNDIDQEWLHLLRTARNHRDDFITAVALTAYSEAELATAFEPIDAEAEPVEAARRIYVRFHMMRRETDTSPTFRRNFVLSSAAGHGRMTANSQTFARIDHLGELIDRMSAVVIESMDAIDLIDMYRTKDAGTKMTDRKFFYLDPPYPRSQRQRWYYKHELSDARHREIVAKLVEWGASDMFLVSSGPPEETYNRLGCNGWRCDQLSEREFVWLSPLLVKALLISQEQEQVSGASEKQLSLFLLS